MVTRSGIPGTLCWERRPESKSEGISHINQRAGKDLPVAVFIRRDGRPSCNIFFEIVEHGADENLANRRKTIMLDKKAFKPAVITAVIVLVVFEALSILVQLIDPEGGILHVNYSNPESVKLAP